MTDFPASSSSVQVRVIANERPTETPALVAPVTPGTELAQLATTATPTQVANPRRTTWRSIVQLLLALFTAVPLIIPIILGTWSPEWLVLVLGQVLAVQTAIVRIMALPIVNAWLTENVPALAAIPSKSITANP